MSFERYRHVIRDARDVRDPRLLITQEGPLEVRYAPFDHVTQTARLIILGITPGEQQANAAIREAGRAIRSGTSNADALARAKAHASFAGPMRANLVAMLDAIGVNGALDIPSCVSLWGKHVDLVQFASALRYPVFKNGENYTGSSPEIIASPALREQLMTHTAGEIATLPNALVLPLGRAVAKACHYLATHSALDLSRVIEGMPHPSGANGERIAYFLGQKDQNALSSKTDPTKIDAGRDTARRTVERWQEMAQPAFRAL